MNILMYNCSVSFLFWCRPKSQHIASIHHIAAQTATHCKTLQRMWPPDFIGMHANVSKRVHVHVLRISCKCDRYAQSLFKIVTVRDINVL